jgi:hypothetical protein
MVLLTVLLCVHFCADFYWQKHAWIMDKVEHKHRSLGLFKHIMVHLVATGLVFVLLLWPLSWQHWLGLLIIISTHYVIDIWKTYQTFSTRSFLIDQGGHYLVIGLVYSWLAQQGLADVSLSLLGISAHNLAVGLAVLLGMIVLYKPAAMTQILIYRSANLAQNENFTLCIRSTITRIIGFLLALLFGLSALFIAAIALLVYQQVTQQKAYREVWIWWIYQLLLIFVCTQYVFAVLTSS